MIARGQTRAVAIEVDADDAAALVNSQLFPEAPVAFLWLRFPMQGALILLAWWYTRDPKTAS